MLTVCARSYPTVSATDRWPKASQALSLRRSRPLSQAVLRPGAARRRRARHRLRAADADAGLRGYLRRRRHPSVGFRPRRPRQLAGPPVRMHGLGERRGRPPGPRRCSRFALPKDPRLQSDDATHVRACWAGCTDNRNTAAPCASACFCTRKPRRIATATCSSPISSGARAGVWGERAAGHHAHGAIARSWRAARRAGRFNTIRASPSPRAATCSSPTTPKAPLCSCCSWAG